MAIRNRIVEHVAVRAGDLIPHPLNFRQHPTAQRQALEACYEDIGFARSLLGYRLGSGRIQLLDGHLRAEIDPDMEVVVELVDVTEEEARKLLLTIDPLAALAETDLETHERLQTLTHTDKEALQNLWSQTRLAKDKLRQLTEPKELPAAAEQHLVVIECVNWKEQKQLLDRFKAEGLKCKALTS